MKKITEKDLLNLGFKKEDVSDPAMLDDGEEPYFYFTFCATEESTLVSPQLITADEDNENDCYCVEFYEHQEIKITDIDELTKLVDILKRNVVK